MTIVEAIERLEVFLGDVSEGAPEILDDAIKLGIEALKHHKKLRDSHPYSNYKILPGETEGD